MAGWMRSCNVRVRVSAAISSIHHCIALHYIIYSSETSIVRNSTRSCNNCKTFWCGGRGEQVLIDSRFCFGMCKRGRGPMTCVPGSCPEFCCPCLVEVSVCGYRQYWLNGHQMQMRDVVSLNFSLFAHCHSPSCGLMMQRQQWKLLKWWEMMQGRESRLDVDLQTAERRTSSLNELGVSSKAQLR